MRSISFSLALLLLHAPHADGRSETLTAHRVKVPALLGRIGWCESRNVYTAQNRRSTASGRFQILGKNHGGTWGAWARRFGADVGATRYARARLAPPHVQDTVAARAFAAYGTRPWSASRTCWSRP